ncbi:hypothetical protein DL98DRAFT_620246 [Cadophora sp. DSE1049]|nr:hypothetical protein DL98DRAFT_620246 [Cadophora sp. DSE1049]
MELFDSLYERWDNLNIAQDPTTQLTPIERHSHMAKVFGERSRRLVSLMHSELKFKPFVSKKDSSLTSAKIRLEPKSSFEYWLELNRKCGAADPRDKVYSVLGLISSLREKAPWNIVCDLNTLILDYNATAEDVYASVVKSIFDATPRLDILGCASPVSMTTLSWVPDWTASGQHSFLFGVPGKTSDNVPRFDADNHSWPYYCDAVLADDFTTLTVGGVLWDYVDQIIVCDTVWEDADENVMSLNSDSGRLWAQAEHTMHYGSEQDCKSAIWRTLFAIPGDTWREENVRRIYDAQVKSGRDVLEHMTKRLEQKNVFSDLPNWTPEAMQSFEQDLQLIKGYASLDYPREFIVTKKGYVGQAPYSGRVRSGDVISVLFGCSIPVILRPVGSHYEFIGDCYLDGIMYGDAIKSLEEGKVQLQAFELH